MSVKYISKAFESDLEPRDRFILVAIADCANDKGVAWPGYSHLMNKTGYAKATIAAGLKKLKELGWLRVENHSTFGNGKKCNIYYMQTPKSSAVELLVVPPQKFNLPKSSAVELPKVQSTDPKSSAVEHEPSLEPSRKKTVIKRLSINSFRPSWISLTLWDEVISNRKFKKLQNTALALKTFTNSLKKGVDAGYSVEICVGEYVASSWKRFNHEWIKGDSFSKQINGKKNTLDHFKEMIGDMQDENDKNNTTESGNCIEATGPLGLPLP